MTYLAASLFALTCGGRTIVDSVLHTQRGPAGVQAAAVMAPVLPAANQAHALGLDPTVYNW